MKFILNYNQISDKLMKNENKLIIFKNKITNLRIIIYLCIKLVTQRIIIIKYWRELLDNAARLQNAQLIIL